MSLSQQFLAMIVGSVPRAALNFAMAISFELKMQFKQTTPVWNHILLYVNVITIKIHICSHFLTIVSNLEEKKTAHFSFFKKVK